MYDVIIVGAGAAGCVLAHRLSEDKQRKILLIEAGPDYPDQDSLPEEIAKSFSTAEITHDWGYSSEADDLGVSIALPRAKVVGGCTATNATVALRGLPDDYTEWVELGNPEWSFDAVLPFFRNLETDHDFDNKWHGSSGPIPIRRERGADLTRLQTAFLQACKARAYPYVEDYNAPDQIGYSHVPKNMIAGLRQSTAVTYLASARPRRNLTIRSNVLVDRILIEGGAAAGVRLAETGEEIKANSVILSAGAYSSPIILMRSGIGPAHHLEEHGIACRVPLAGVGSNLSDHPLFCMEFATNWIPPDGRVQMIQTMLTRQSELGRYKQDIQIFPMSITQPADPDASPGTGYTRINMVLLKPHSRGQVQLRSGDPTDSPRIDLGYFTHPDDLPRMVEAARRVRELAGTSPLSDMLVEETYPSSQAISDADLGSAIRSRIKTIHHPVGTCRMGPAGDADAVVDARGKVHGLDGLYVIDASIMPTVPAANTNLPTIMVAERCAAWLQRSL